MSSPSDSLMASSYTRSIQHQRHSVASSLLPSVPCPPRDYMFCVSPARSLYRARVCSALGIQFPEQAGEKVPSVEKKSSGKEGPVSSTKYKQMESGDKVLDASSSSILTSGASGRVNVLFSLRAVKSVSSVLKAVVLLLLFPFQLRNRSASEKHKEEKYDPKVSSILQVVPVMVPRRNSTLVTKGMASASKEGAIRRALAIKRVIQDRNSGSDRKFSLFSTARGDALFSQCWSPVSVKVRGLLIIMHGLNEHSGRYDAFAKQLNANGYKVYGIDWIGHGGSDGLHGFVHSLDAAVNDTKKFLVSVLSENSGFPCYLFGHSTGAAIILKAALDPEVDALTRGMVLTSPAIKVQPSHPIFGLLAPIFSLLLPKYQFNAANKPGLLVSRDPEALMAKYSDPLVYTGSIRVRTGSEILRITSYLQQNLSRVRLPFLVLHGTADTITDPDTSRMLYESAASKDKSLKLYEGFLHDLLFEPERETVMKDIVDWLNVRVLK